MRRSGKEERGLMTTEQLFPKETLPSADEEEEKLEEGEEDGEVEGDDSSSKFDHEIERIGIGWFHYIAISILGLG